jgi:hypothetical protein
VPYESRRNLNASSRPAASCGSSRLAIASPMRRLNASAVSVRTRAIRATSGRSEPPSRLAPLSRSAATTAASISSASRGNTEEAAPSVEAKVYARSQPTSANS